MQTASQLANGPLGNQAEYQRHRPETTVLYRIVEQNWPKLEALLMDETQPDQPIRQWVISFPFQLRILLAPSPPAPAAEANI